MIGACSVVFCIAFLSFEFSSVRRVAMECLRAMSSVCTGSTSLAIGRSDVGRGAGASVSFCGRVGGVAAVSVPRVPVQGAGLRALTLQRKGVRACASSADEPLDYKVDKAATEAGREFDETKQSIGSSAEDLQEKASSEVDESKQSLSSTMEDLKRKASETKSIAEDTANKVRGCRIVAFLSFLVGAWWKHTSWHAFYTAWF